MRPSTSSILFLWAALSGGGLAASDSDKTTTTAPCTATSTSEAFYDLRHDIAYAVEEGQKLPFRGARTSDYTARGYDLKVNFTMNICAAVIKPPKEAVGIDDKLAKNISAYYERRGKVYSLG
jgi:cation-dependent mannose-6-phosphate receptor